jgi:hypothetical protein
VSFGSQSESVAFNSPSPYYSQGITFNTITGNYLLSIPSVVYNSLVYFPYSIFPAIANFSPSNPTGTYWVHQNGAALSITYHYYPVGVPISNLPAPSGCSQTGTIYNLYTQTNQSCVNLPSSAILYAIVNNLGANATVLNYTVGALVDTWYGGSSAEAAVVNCRPLNPLPPCFMTFYLNSAGGILNTTSSD